MKKIYKKWKTEEVALIRAAIKNDAEDLSYLTKSLDRSTGSVVCKLGRERMIMGLSPKGYTGLTIGYRHTGPISI